MNLMKYDPKVKHRLYYWKENIYMHINYEKEYLEKNCWLSCC